MVTLQNAVLLFVMATLPMSAVSQQDKTESTLRHIHLIFRHGDRSPYIMFPNIPDVQPPSAWPMGLKQLTPTGMKQHFTLGTYLRRWYGEELGLTDEYMREDVYARSTEADRALMSAASNLAGLYYQTSDEFRWLNGTLPWVPIPIHSTTKANDFLLTEVHCPRYEELRKMEFSSDFVRNKEKEASDLFRLLESKLSPPGQIVPRNLTNLWEIQDTLFCQERHKMSQPSWFTEKVAQQTYELTDLGWRKLYETQEMAKLRAGFLVAEIADTILQLSEGRKRVNGNKLIMYSCHDSNVAPLLASLNVFNGRQPPYAAAVIIELHHQSHPVNEADSWFVRIRYYNTSDEEDSQLALPPALLQPQCGNVTDCPLPQFLKLTSPYRLTMKEYPAACGISVEPPAPSSNAVTVIFLVLLVLAVIFLTVVIVLLKFRIRRIEFDNAMLVVQQQSASVSYENMREVV